MPFDFKDYQTKCDGMSTEQLHREWENYTRQISGGATSTATSVLFAPVTGGVSLVGLGLAAPKIHNARKKREIIEAGLKARGTAPNTRKRDVIAPMAVAGTIGTLTVGLAGGAASHVALDAGGSALEHQHGKHQHQKASQRLEAQYENFKVQYAQEQAAAQGVQYPVAGYQPGLNIPGSVQNPQGPQSTNLAAPSGANLPGPPNTSYDQIGGNVPLPASYYAASQQSMAHQQNTFYAGAAFEINASYTTSHQQANDSAHQLNSHQQQTYASTSYVSGYPPEKPSISSYPSPCPTPLPLYSPPQTVPAQPEPSPLQHRPSLPTPNITPHAPVHRPSLPVDPAPAIVPAAPPPSTIHEIPTPASPIYEMSTSTGRTTPFQNEPMLSVEEQLALLRMKVLQLELEKRGEHVEVVLEDDKEEDEDETSKPPEIPETFPTEAHAPEPPRRKETNPKPVEEEVGVAPPSGRPTEPPTAPSPKLNVFVDLQQPAPLDPTKPQYKVPTPQNNLPYPTFSTPQPEKQQEHPPPKILTPPIPTSAHVSAQAAAAHKTGFSITGGISIAYNRDASQSQTPANPQANYAVGSASNESESGYQHTLAQGHRYSTSQAQVPPPSTYQAYNPHHRTSSIPMSPQQQMPIQNQGFPISYEAAPPQPQSNAGFQTYNPAEQNSTTPGPQQQQVFATPQKPLPPQHTDSGYYSNPASNPGSRHSSSFSVATVASLNIDHSHVVSPPTPQYATLNQQPNAPQQTQYSNARHSSYGQMPTTYTPSPMSPPPPQYFPPPPTSAPPRFGQQNNTSRAATPMQPAPHLASPAPIYGNMQTYQPGPASAPPVYGGQQGGNGGWQWGNPQGGALGEPNYGAPPPIPEVWRGS